MRYYPEYCRTLNLDLEDSSTDDISLEEEASEKELPGMA